MRCARCGHEYAEGALFCSGCGEVAPNLSEEDAKMAALLSHPGRKPPVVPNIGVQGTTEGVKTPSGFGIASAAFILGTILLLASLLMRLVYGEAHIFSDDNSWSGSDIDLVERVMVHTGNLGWVALAAGLLLVLRGIAERRRRGQGILWPDFHGMNNAMAAALITIALECTVFAADAAFLEMGAQWDISFRVVYYLTGVTAVTLALTLYIATDSLRRANTAL